MKKNSKSFLAENNFSSYNLRDAYITDIVDYLAVLRDESIFSNYGIKALIRIPSDKDGNILENNIDEYSNFVDKYWIDITETVVPKFTAYRQNISQYGMSADGIDGLYPLEVIIPSKLHLPRNSRIIFTEYNGFDDKIAREWVVLSTLQKQLSASKTYSKVANCVPAREGSYDNCEMAIGNIYFDYSINNLLKTKKIHSLNIIWFDVNLIDKNSVNKLYTNSIYEQIPEYPLITEQISLLMYYSDNPSCIIESGTGFNINDEFDIVDINNIPIKISLAEDESNYIPFKLIVSSVDENGGITSFKLNTNFGYTNFSIFGDLKVNLKSSSGKNALISLQAIPWNGDINQESINVNGEKHIKYIKTNNMIALFKARPIAISVLN